MIKTLHLCMSYGIISFSPRQNKDKLSPENIEFHGFQLVSAGGNVRNRKEATIVHLLDALANRFTDPNVIRACSVANFKTWSTEIHEVKSFKLNPVSLQRNMIAFDSLTEAAELEFLKKSSTNLHLVAINKTIALIKAISFCLNSLLLMISHKTRLLIKLYRQREKCAGFIQVF